MGNSHLSIAQSILDTYHAVRIRGSVYFFAGGAWHHGERMLDELIVSLDPGTTKNDRAEIRDLVLLKAPDGAFAPARYVAFANGVLDLVTMECSAPSPDRFVPNQVPWKWDPDAHSDEVEAYLVSTAADDDSTLARIEELLGACLYRGKLPYFFILVGTAPVRDGDASNGKSTLVELCCREVGEENSLALDIHLFGRRFMAGNIAGRLVVGSPDSPSTRPDAAALSVLKSVVSGDTITSDVKNRPLVEFKPYATVVMAANKVPPFLTDAGLRRRAVVITMKGQFPKGGADPLDTIATPEHMPALLVHAVTGLKRLLAQGATPSTDGEAAFSSIVALSSTVEQWVSDEGIEPAGLDGEPCTVVYQKYATWCAFAGEKELTRGEFDHEITNRWPGLHAERCRRNGQPTTKRWIFSARPGGGATGSDD